MYEEDRLNGLLDPADEITDGFFNLTDAEDYAASALPLLRGEETIPDLGRRPTLRDTMKFLDERYRQRVGKQLTEFTQENVEAVAQQMATEAAEAAAKAGNAKTRIATKFLMPCGLHR